MQTRTIGRTLRKSYIGLALMMVFAAAYALAYKTYYSLGMGQAEPFRQEKSDAERHLATPKVLEKEGSVKDAGPLYHLSFSRDGYIYLLDMRRKSVRQVVKGDDPSLSPLGTSVAFTHVEENTDSFRSTIKTFDLVAGTLTEFSSLSKFTSRKPQRAPDGNKVAFEYKSEFQWRVGVVDVVKNQWEDLMKTLTTDRSVFLSSWAAEIVANIRHTFEELLGPLLHLRLPP